MKINIVRADDSWILGNITRHYAELLNCEIQPVGFRGDSDINIYITYGTYRKPTNAIDIGWFTHKENDNFDKIARSVDYCIAMSAKTALQLPADKTIVITPGIDEQFTKDKIVFGCVGREYPSKRKKFHWIHELQKIPHTLFKFTNGKIAWDAMPAFYENIDYLLILSDNEGGPMPVLEAMAMGKPVISPDVGWAWQLPCIKYTDFTHLQHIIHSLIIPKNSWELSAKKLYRFCERVLKCPNTGSNPISG